MRDSIAAATSSAVWICGPDPPAGDAQVTAGVPPRAFFANSVVTIPGITSETCTSGYWRRRSMRRLAVSAFKAAFAALYADRYVASGTRERNDETLMR